MADSPSPGRTDAASGRPGPLRVAMVIQRFRPLFSGQGEQVELLCRVLARRGLEPTVITSAYGQPTSTEERPGYHVVRLRSDSPRLASRGGISRLHGPMFGGRVLAHLLRHGAFDVVHVHTLTDALYTSWLWCRLRRRPLLFEMTLVGADDAVTIMGARGRLAAMRTAIFQRCDGYVAISPALEETCRQAGLPGHKVRVLPQGVDVREFRPADDRLALRRTLGLPETGPLLMFVGSLVRRKGIDLLLKAWARIHAAFPRACLALAGPNRFPSDSPDTGFLRDQMAMLPPAAARGVLELGVRSDVSQLLQAADLFVFPSRREGFGTVMIEAMACGLACVVAEQPGITDFIFGQEPRAGVVVPQDDEEAIAAAVVAMLSDRARAEAAGREARALAVERFDIERIADRYVDYYSDVVAGTRGGRGVQR